MPQSKSMEAFEAHIRHHFSLTPDAVFMWREGYPVAVADNRSITLGGQWRDWQAACAHQRERDAEIIEAGTIDLKIHDWRYDTQEALDEFMRSILPTIAAAIRGQG